MPIIDFEIQFGAWRSLASALEWGSRGRWFKSTRPDHISVKILFLKLTIEKQIGEKMQESESGNYYSPPERRQFVRINTNFVVSYYVYPGELNKTDMTLTRNVSLGGICFTTDKNFPKGTILHVTLRLPKVNHLIEVLAEVVYVKQEKNKKLLFDIGIKFIKVEDKDLMILEQTIKNCASDGKKIYLAAKVKKEKK